jgi:hypothetical protein
MKNVKNWKKQSRE